MKPENIHLIVCDEVGAEYAGDKRYYNKKCAKPTYAGGDSGVTIGIGYDLGYNTKEQIKKAWEGKVSANHLSFFMSCSGIKGQQCKKLITPTTVVLTVPYETAMDVFMNVSLPKFTALTRSIYPNLDNLNETTQAVLIGLVYNRGESLGEQGKPSWERRREMRELVALTNAADYAGIAACVERMKRLWIGTDVTGLVDRREREALAILKSVQTGSASDNMV